MVVGIEAIAGAKILHEWIALPVWQIGLVLLVILTAVNLLSSRTFGEFEFWFASIKVAAIVAFIAIAAAYAFGLTSPSGPQFGNLFAHGGFAPFGVVAVLSGVTTVIFALCGAEIATIAAVESSAGAQVISRSTSTIVVRILLFYVLSIALIVAVVPWREIAPGVSPFVVALQRMHVPGAGLLMSFIVLTAVLSCLNSGLYVTSRVLFTLSAHGDAPRSMVQLSRRRVPARAILIGTSFGYFAVIASIISPEVVFAFLVNASGAIMLIVYLLIAFAQIRLRRRLERTDPGRPHPEDVVVPVGELGRDSLHPCRSGCHGIHPGSREPALCQPRLPGHSGCKLLGFAPPLWHTIGLMTRPGVPGTQRGQHRPNAAEASDSRVDRFADETLTVVCRALGAEWGSFYRLGGNLASLRVPESGDTRRSSE